METKLNNIMLTMKLKTFLAKLFNICYDIHMQTNLKREYSWLSYQILNSSEGCSNSNPHSAQSICYRKAALNTKLMM